MNSGVARISWEPLCLSCFLILGHHHVQICLLVLTPSPVHVQDRCTIPVVISLVSSSLKAIIATAQIQAFELWEMASNNIDCFFDGPQS